MGTPLPPNVPGVDCTSCWGAGQTFHDPSTPKFITLTFSGFQQGALWLDVYEQTLLAPHLLTQTVSSCIWVVIDSFFSWLLSYNGGFPRIHVQQKFLLNSACLNTTGSNCQLSYPNELITPTGNITFDGQMQVSWNPEGL